MRTPLKLGAYALGLAAVFTAAVGVGNLAGPTGSAPAAHTDDGHGARPDAAGHDEQPQSGTPKPPGGLQVAQDGYRLVPLTPALSTGTAQPLRFHILGPDNVPVTRYTTSHDKDLHLIVVRRDLAGYQHLHPQLDANGIWSVPVSIADAGQYRIFADFIPAGRADGLTLGADIPVAGDYRPRALPEAQRTTTVDGYTVTLTGDLTPGTASRLTLAVSLNGAPVTDLQPYLGAYGHLVALREGDLAYLHVHPDGAPGDGRTAAGPQVTFHAEVPTAGSYRLFLDFQHNGTVRTAEFTAVAGSAPVPAGPASPAPTPAPSGTGHGDPGHSHS
ncbi:hypothetical protein Val02_49220 [Virgisporangium aliadipatigenens]|uniref:Secreted protein n=1 Tax=Virgisporangium aliadipatigenens TaxID=741659 RepID=A0A8J3YQI2_9ACTN|nr:hypothetical protein [Virgisporangium aliadipatigenens]GIJ48036.1 hypothetical protein Val02_49220 [Virgisporangium aliadipatigenens]